ncbi:TetR/AcrR family transcriptional regulator [Microbacterium amylolyticum]|uniref:AcrR family transcriptional regulator n=1 Tax=Microbacterium amylolyticum TaxID=936337 RepID=A0ABS4ZFM0_9MICO|nr:TetR/AcrR family transcriptional regulator [Microbacterium amylolyticum]MBP2436072.1 AcrR family transcriptional regulator [Microbacterium amylolyticum]
MDAARSVQKRELILERALEVFVAHGYVGTTTDQLAAAASVSKQTLYKEFGDKEGVFAALIRFACDRVDDPFAPLVDQMRNIDSADDAVALMATQFSRSIMSPYVQQLRRLVIAEATRFPDLGQLYWEEGFLRVVNSVARCLSILDERGMMEIPEARLAAHHFAGLLLWIPSNQTMFAATMPLGEQELIETITAGSQAFLRAYRVNAA